MIINRNKFDWETLDTPKIKTVFYSIDDFFNNEYFNNNDYGSKLRIKCHQRMQRKEKSIDGEMCTNWDRIDSFGVELHFDGSVHHEKFYNNNPSWRWSGNGL